MERLSPCPLLADTHALDGDVASLEVDLFPGGLLSSPGISSSAKEDFTAALKDALSDIGSGGSSLFCARGGGFGLGLCLLRKKGAGLGT